MNAPMVGNWSVEVKKAEPFTIHGDLYYELHVIRLDDPAGGLFAFRVPRHALTAVPLPNQNLILTFLMGQVTSAKPIEPPGS